MIMSTHICIYNDHKPPNLTYQYFNLSMYTHTYNKITKIITLKNTNEEYM